MKKMAKKFTVLILLIFSFGVYSQTTSEGLQLQVQAGTASMMNMLKSLKISDQQIDASVNELVQSGLMTKEEGEQVKASIKNQKTMTNDKNILGSKPVYEYRQKYKKSRDVAELPQLESVKIEEDPTKKVIENKEIKEDNELQKALMLR